MKRKNNTIKGSPTATLTFYIFPTLSTATGP